MGSVSLIEWIDLHAFAPGILICSVANDYVLKILVKQENILKPRQHFLGYESIKDKMLLGVQRMKG